ncbi:MAG: hypothetical protein OXD42_13550 [Rhodospirillaceae bacterium]|nr:hypothetical protein [Rhodospirillaceae bacterium]MCY4238913.1 hypothetical protein [Rhodospirillaceae bacterium]
MSRIKKARERLERAVTRLERSQRGQNDEIVRLKEAHNASPDPAEIDRLGRALDETKRKNAALTAEREAIADRMDITIDRLRAVAGMDSAEDR